MHTSACICFTVLRHCNATCTKPEKSQYLAAIVPVSYVCLYVHVPSDTTDDVHVVLTPNLGNESFRQVRVAG
jgi:hypothetical protein